ncbi:TPA: hypothetical protein I7256_08015 [Vibrio vulnificus]|nr:hypothetical protein [Vibrio vulnificus]HAS6412478.1 hypothetical protein [Vibrio vulnificus]
MSFDKIIPFPPNYGTFKPENNGKHLKPCPFCAAKPHIEQDQDETWYVACINKHCLVLPLTRPFMTRIQAVRAWNSRPQAIKSENEKSASKNSEREC